MIIVDFEDSFTYNLASDCQDLGFSPKVIHWKNLKKTDYDQFVIWGPGPGNPLEYEEIFPLIQDWLTKDIFHLGVCLGHQILGLLFGGKCVPSHHPVHGQRVEICLPTWEEFAEDQGKIIKVQSMGSVILGPCYGVFLFLVFINWCLVSIKNKNIQQKYMLGYKPFFCTLNFYLK